MELIEQNSYNWHQDGHRALLRGMLMTGKPLVVCCVFNVNSQFFCNIACDLAAITKPWEVEKRVCYRNLFKNKNMNCWKLSHSKFTLSDCRVGSIRVFWARRHRKGEIKDSSHCKLKNTQIMKNVCLLNPTTFIFKDMMNREKKDELPSMQIAFIDSICEPVYAVRANYF